MGAQFYWSAAPSPAIPNVAPGTEVSLTLLGANSALNAPNAFGSDSANTSGPNGLGAGFAVNTVNSLLWANARANGTVGALIIAMINAGQIVVVQA